MDNYLIMGDLLFAPLYYYVYYLYDIYVHYTYYHIYYIYINKWEEWKSWNTNYCWAAEIYKSITFLKIGELILFLKISIKVCMGVVSKS